MVSNIIETEGHKFVDGYCVRCGRRLQHYNESLKLLFEWEEEIPVEILATIVCKSILVVPTKSSEYIEPIGWGTYFRRQHIPSYPYPMNELPGEVCYWTSIGAKRQLITHYNNDELMELVIP